MRLQRFLARAGLDSRRHAEGYITAGRVSVNGEIVTTLGVKVGPDDEVRVDGELMTLPERTVTLMLHKPLGVITTMGDPFGRRSADELLPDDVAGLFHVGRLDGDSTGLLLFTNDGDLGFQLVHPRTHVPKRYVVALRDALGRRALKKLREGIVLDGKRTLPAGVELIDKARARQLFGQSAPTIAGAAKVFATITLHEGRTRQIRAMFEALGNEVLTLHRFALGSLKLGGLEVGKWRELTAEEVARLRRDIETASKSC